MTELPEHPRTVTDRVETGVRMALDLDAGRKWAPTPLPQLPALIVRCVVEEIEADRVNAGERPQPRVWRVGEHVPAGTCVQDRGGCVYVFDRFERNHEVEGRDNGPLVEVVLSDHAAAVAADNARRAAES